MNLARLLFISDILEAHCTNIFLTESFRTTETKIRGLVREFLNKAAYSCRNKLTQDEKMGIRTDSYGYLALYVKKLMDRGQYGSEIYSESWTSGSYEVSLSLNLGDEKIRVHGVTNISTINPNKITINMYILPREARPIFDALEVGSIPYKYMKTYMDEMKSHIVHEITHLFQLKNSRLDSEITRKINKMEEYKAFAEVQHYFYLLQEHECDARVREAIKLFLSKLNYTENKNGESFRKTKFYDILFNIILKSLRNGTLVNKAYNAPEGTPLENAIKYGTTPDRFFLVWFFWVFIEKNSKFKHYTFPNGTPQLSDDVDLNVVENNKKNIDVFLKELKEDDIKKLAFIIMRHSPIRFKESVFSTRKENKQYLALLQNSLV